MRTARWVVYAFGLSIAALIALPTSCAKRKPCERNSDCVKGYCEDGECKTECVVSELDCPRGWVCNDVTGRCEEPGDGGLGDAQSGDASEAETGASGSGGGAGDGPGGSAGSAGTAGGAGSAGSGQAGSAGASGSAGTGGSSGELREFDRCSSDADCASPLVCRDMNKGHGDMRCTRPCTMSQQCMAGTKCTYGTNYCAFDDSGKPCSGVSGECNDACSTSVGYCTTMCSSGYDCPAGWACSPATGGKACLRLDQVCGMVLDQPDYSACLSQAHCDEQSMFIGGCTSQCSSANDCPQRPSALPRWTCDGVKCMRPGDTFGSVPKEEHTYWTCYDYGGPRVNLCADGLTLDQPPAELDCNNNPYALVPSAGYCVQTCRYEGGCGWGYECVGHQVSLNGTATGLGLCVRKGSLGIGQPCSSDEACEFGLCLKDEAKCSRDCSYDGVCPSGTTCQSAPGAPVDSTPFRVCK